MNSPFSTAVAQIANGQTFDQWHRPTTTKEVTVKQDQTAAAGLRDKMLALFKPGIWMKKAQLADALKVSPDTLTWHIGAAIKDKELIAHGNTGNRAFALPGTAVPKTNGDKPAKAETKPAKSETNARKVVTKAVRAETQEQKPAFIDQAIDHLLFKRDSIDKAIAALQAL